MQKNYFKTQSSMMERDDETRLEIIGSFPLLNGFQADPTAPTHYHHNVLQFAGQSPCRLQLREHCGGIHGCQCCTTCWGNQHSMVICTGKDMSLVCNVELETSDAMHFWYSMFKLRMHVEVDNQEGSIIRL